MSTPYGYRLQEQPASDGGQAWVFTDLATGGVSTPYPSRDAAMDAWINREIEWEAAP